MPNPQRVDYSTFEPPINVIAQDDDNDYQESGWICFECQGVYYLARYSHCSCYGTWTDLVGGGINDDGKYGEVRSDWSGSLTDLLNMAENQYDPHFPGRIIDPEDYDYDHLQAVYQEILNRFLPLPKQA